MFVEWMMGLAPGWVTDVPDLSRRQKFSLLGNGVVPAQLSEALGELLPAWRQATASADDTQARTTGAHR